MSEPYFKLSTPDKLRRLASDVDAGEQIHPDTLTELAAEVARLERQLNEKQPKEKGDD